jgi:hypothetical protein
MFSVKSMIKLKDLTVVRLGWKPYWNNLCVFCVHSVYTEKGGEGDPQGAGDTNAASEIYGYNFSVFCTRNALIQRYVNI